MYCIAGKFGGLADRRAYCQIKNHDIACNACPLCCPPNFVLTLVEANPPNLIPANISGYTVSKLHAHA